MVGPVAASSPPISAMPNPSPLLRGGRGGRRDAVYVAAVTLRATRGPAQMVASTAYSLGLWDLQHFIVIVRPDTSSTRQSQAYAFDFQPRDPENVCIAFAALSRRRVPGVVLKRVLSRVPKNRCWFVGFSNCDGVDVADKFSADWEMDLVVGNHDCRHYTNGLVECLTGEMCIVEHLKERIGS